MWAFLAGMTGRWLVGGAIGALLIGGFIVWHKVNFVSRAEVQQWQEYAKNLTKAVEEKENKLRRYEAAKEEHDAKVEELEKEREKLLDEDRKRDDPIILRRDDVERLRRN